MKKLINKIKNYRPPKHICFLYFFIPIFISTLIKLDKETDIFFLLNHGKYVLSHGFPTIEPFSMHHDFAFVMQQWLSAVIFYLTYKIASKYGLLLLLVSENILIIYFLYKLTMTISDNHFRLSVITSCLTDVLLLIYIVPRPQIFTYLILIITLYILEKFIKNKDTKAIYFLPVLSLIQINMHASMYFMLYLFILPYLISLAIMKYKDRKDKRLDKLILIIIIMFLSGFLNPYGIKNITYIFTSYGNYYINNSIVEMFPPQLTNKEFISYFFLTYLTILIIFLSYMFNKKTTIRTRHLLLLLGTSFLAITSIRNYPLLVIGSLPFLSYYIKDLIKPKKEKTITLTKKDKTLYLGVIAFLCLYTIAVTIFRGVSFTNKLESGIDYLLSKYKSSDIILYTNYSDGSYAEYRGLKPYIDSRAEIFLKSNNKKADIMKEYYLIDNNLLDYNYFINKYKFTHLIVSTDCSLYKHLIKDKNYQVFYNGGTYKIFEKV